MGAYFPAIRTTISGSIRSRTSRPKGSAMPRMSSCAAATSNEASRRCSAAPATGASSAAASQCGFRPEPEREQCEETHEHEVADENPRAERAAPAVDAAVRLDEAVPLEVREHEGDGKRPRLCNPGCRDGGQEQGEVLGHEPLGDGDEPGDRARPADDPVAPAANVEPGDERDRRDHEQR